MDADLIRVTCDRCGRQFIGLDSGVATGGFYRTGTDTLWHEFANEGENVVCRPCMENDSRYAARCGKKDKTD